MVSFTRVFYKLVFHQSKCVSAIKRVHSTIATYISSSFFIHLCIPCSCDACLKSSALCVGVKTLRYTNANKQKISLCMVAIFIVGSVYFADSGY